jgi:hypothetical protein
MFVVHQHHLPCIQIMNMDCSSCSRRNRKKRSSEDDEDEDIAPSGTARWHPEAPPLFRFKSLPRRHSSRNFSFPSPLVSSHHQLARLHDRRPLLCCSCAVALSPSRTARLTSASRNAAAAASHGTSRQLISSSPAKNAPHTPSPPFGGWSHGPRPRRNDRYRHRRPQNARFASPPSFSSKGSALSRPFFPSFFSIGAGVSSPFF